MLKDSVLPDDLGHFLASLIHSAAWVVPWSCEFRILRRQDPRWIRVSATSARAEDGAIVWDGVMVDITELREREDRIRGIMEATIDAIVTIDEIGVIETVNRSTQTMFGYAAEQLLGRNINIRLIPLLPVRLDIDVRNATVSAGGLRKSQRSPCLIRAFQQWEGTQHHALPEPRG